VHEPRRRLACLQIFGRKGQEAIVAHFRGAAVSAGGEGRGGG